MQRNTLGVSVTDIKPKCPICGQQMSQCGVSDIVAIFQCLGNNSIRGGHWVTTTINNDGLRSGE